MQSACLSKNQLKNCLRVYLIKPHLKTKMQTQTNKIVAQLFSSENKPKRIFSHNIFAQKQTKNFCEKISNIFWQFKFITLQFIRS